MATRAERRRLERDMAGLPERVAALRRFAMEHPWDGQRILGPRHHLVWPSGLTEPGRRTRVTCSLEANYHGSGWWKNADYERCLHIAVSHPTGQQVVRMLPMSLGGGHAKLFDADECTPRELTAWARLFFGTAAHMAWTEAAASTLDIYRLPGVSHARLFFNEQGEPFIPDGEVYSLKRIEGLTPEKLMEGP